MKNCFLKTGGVNIEGRRIKCIRFADDMALLAEDENMLKNMLMELNDRCEDYGMNINISKTKPWLSEEREKSTLVIQWLSYSPLDPRFAGSIPAGLDGFFQSVKILSMTSFGRKVKPWVPCRRFTAREITSSRN